MPSDLRGDELTNQILDTIAKEGMVPREVITPDATMESLGFASMDIILILSGIERKFDVDIPIDGKLADCRDMRGFVAELTEVILRKQSG